VKLKAELEGPDPTTIERHLAERTMICWLDMQVSHVKALDVEDSPAYTTAEKNHLQKSHDRAHRRYVGCLKALALVRNKAIPALRLAVAVKGQDGSRAEASVEMDGPGGPPVEEAVGGERQALA